MRKKEPENKLHWIEQQLNQHVDDMPDLEDRHRALIKTTLIPQAVYFDGIAVKNKGKDYFWSLTIILAGLTTAILGPAGLTEQFNWTGWFTALSGVLISLATKLRDEFKYAQTYERSRLACERIQSEMRSFFFQSGDYASISIDVALRKMHQRIEDINRGSVSQKFRDPEDEAEDLGQPITRKGAPTRVRPEQPEIPSSTPKFSYKQPEPAILYGENDSDL